MLAIRHDPFRDQKFHRIRKHYGRTCLDVGSGFGHFSAFLAAEGISVTALDIVDKGEHPEIETVLFDGRNIPYDAKSFDTTIAMFVLHYSDDPLQLLGEIGRVTKSRIIIGEDITDSYLDKVLSRLHMLTTAWGHRQSGIFHSNFEWQKIFVGLNWRLIETVELPRQLMPSYPIHRRVYVVEP